MAYSEGQLALLHLHAFLDFPGGKVSVICGGDPSLSLIRDQIVNHLGLSLTVNPITITFTVTLPLYSSLKTPRN